MPLKLACSVLTFWELVSVEILNFKRLILDIQVYQFAQMDSTDMEQAEGMREYTPPKKKKKKKHSQWLNHCRKTQFKDVGMTQVIYLSFYLDRNIPGI